MDDFGNPVTRHGVSHRLCRTGDSRRGRTLFDPDQPFDVVDYGDGCVWDILRDDGETRMRLPTSKFMQMEWLTPGCTQVLGGAAHLQKIRTDKSLAQPLSESQVRELASRVNVYLFPDRMNTTALRLLHDTEEVSDFKRGIEDCKAMRHWAKNRRRTQLPSIRMKFGGSEWYEKYKVYNDRTNQILNWARTFDDEVKYITDENSKAVADTLCWRHRDESLCIRYTVMACFVDPVTGENRRLDGKLVGAGFVYEYLVGTPFGDGCVARSNVMWHGWRHELGTKTAGNSSKYVPIGLMGQHMHSDLLKRRGNRRKKIKELIKECRSIRDGTWEFPKVKMNKEEVRTTGANRQMEMFS